MSSDIGSATPTSPPAGAEALVLAEIRSTPKGVHLDARAVFERVRERARPALDFAAVQHALARLSESGHIKRLDHPATTGVVYEQKDDGHAHFRCTSCGTFIDVDFVLSREVTAELAARHGIAIAPETTTFAGRCADCAR